MLAEPMVTDTAPPLPPLPAAWPSCRVFVPPTVPLLADGAIADSPPPPPMLCTTMALDCTAVVEITPVLATLALPPAPEPPVPPRIAVVPSPVDGAPLPDSANTPRPPPSPIDWAIRPLEAAPDVTIWPELVTLTTLPFCPLPPLLPNARLAETVSFELGMATVDCPMPPPPPIDWTTMPDDAGP